MKKTILISLIFSTAIILNYSCNKDDDNDKNDDKKVLEDTTFTDSRDGQVYKIVKIGNQTWMAENLKYNISLSYCYYDIPDSCEIFGRLYKWQNASGACPAGWHLPSNSEWDTLAFFLGGYGVAGGKMKAVGTTYWKSPNTGATNSSGFNAMGAGIKRCSSGLYDLYGEYGYWWSSTECSYNESYAVRAYFDRTTLGLHYYSKSAGYSIRCIKD